MPQKLNIPLHRSTARPRRRAVWQWGMPLCLLIFMWIGARAIAVMNPFHKLVPNGATAGIILWPTNKQWDIIHEGVGEIPLVDGGVALNELRPAITGPLALFFLPKGDRILLFEGRLSEEKADSFKNAGLWVGEPKRGTTTIATHEVELIEMPIPKRFLSLLPTSAGTIASFSPESKWQGTIAVTNGHVGIMTHRMPYAERFIPSENIRLFASFRGKDIGTPEILDAIFSDLTGGRTFDSVLAELTEAGGSFLADASQGFLYQFQKETQEPTLRKIMQTRWQVKNVAKQGRKLPDGTMAEEVMVQSGMPNIARLENDGWIILRLETDNLLLAATGKGKTFITNSPALALAASQEQKIPLTNFAECGKNEGLFASIPWVFDTFGASIHEFSTGMGLSSTKFVNIGLDRGLFFDKIVLCIGSQS